MNVHQIVDDTALDVVKYTVHQVTAAHVHDLYVGQIPAGRKSVSNLRCEVLIQSILTSVGLHLSRTSSRDW